MGQPFAKGPNLWHLLMACRSARGFQSESWITAQAMLGRSVPRPQQLTVCMKINASLQTVEVALRDCILPRCQTMYDYAEHAKTDAGCQDWLYHILKLVRNPSD